MKWTVDRQEFASALGLANSCVRRKASIPILSHVLLESFPDGKLVIGASDMNHEVKIEIGAQLDEAGEVAVPAAPLLAIASRSAGETVELEIGTGTVKAQSGRSHYELATLPAVDFPRIGFTGNESTAIFNLTGGSIQQAIAETAYAADEDSLRIYMTGVSVHQAAGNWCCVGCDGHRFARMEFEAPENGAELAPFILPAGSAALVAKLFPGPDLQLSANAHKVCFTGNGIAFVTRLVDATFPEYTRLIPEEASHMVALDRDEFAAALDRIKPFVGDSGIVCSFHDGSVRITAAGKNKSGADEIPCYGDVPFDFLVNHEYLVDGVSKLRSGGISIRFTEKTAPVILKGHRTEVLHLVMPRNF
jgi:DNA polymerase III subunit beta